MKIRITISDKIKNFHEAVEVIKENDSGVIQGEYTMPLSEVINCFMGAGEQSSSMETPVLPRGCIKLQSNPIGHQVYMDIPKRKWLISYQEQTVQIGFPRMIFKYDILKNQIRAMQIVAIQETGRITGKTTLYHFPYTNVNKENAVVCMGGNEYPTIKDLAQLETIHDIFFSAPFGEDYGCMLTEGQRFHQILPIVEEKEFIDDWLIPIGSTFNEYFKLSN